MTVPPEIKRLRFEAQMRHGKPQGSVWIDTAEQAVRDADARARREERERLTTGSMKRRIFDAIAAADRLAPSDRVVWAEMTEAVLAALAEQGEPDDD